LQQLQSIILGTQIVKNVRQDTSENHKCMTLRTHINATHTK